MLVLIWILVGALVGLFLLGPRTSVRLFWQPHKSRIQSPKPPAQLTSADLKALRTTLIQHEADRKSVV